MARARSLFDAGARSFDAGDFEAAIQAFEQANRVVPRDNLVFSIAQAHKKQFVAVGDVRHLRAAIEHYRRYVAAVPTGGRKAEAIAALEELDRAALRHAGPEGETPGQPGAPLAAEKQKTRLWISSRTPGAVFSIDGGPEAPVGRSVEVVAGPHRVRFSAPGHVEQQVAVVAVEGELVPETLELRAKPARLVISVDAGASVFVDGRFVGDAPLPDALELPPGRHYVSLSLSGHESQGALVPLAGGDEKVVDAMLESTGQRDVARGFLAAGGTFIVASAVFFVVAGVRHGDARNIYQEHLTQNISVVDVRSYDEAISQRDRFALAGTGTGIVGFLVGMVGAGLYVFDEGRPLSVPLELERPGAPAPAPTPSTFEMSATPSVGPSGPDGAAGFLRGRF